MKHSKVRGICEAAILIALAQVLSYIKIYELPNGGSIDCAMLPIILFAVRWGWAPGLGAGFVYGILQYILGSGFAIDWTTIICDYMLAYAVLGLGAGFFKGKKYGVYWGSIVGGALRFVVHFVIGATVWGKWMPDEFFGMSMTSPWFYSLLYNGSYMLPDIVIVVILFALLYHPLKKYFTGTDLQKA
jgi:thiamine transporter